MNDLYVKRLEIVLVFINFVIIVYVFFYVIDIGFLFGGRGDVGLYL